MYRPGGFIEYSPKEQKIFDILHKTIAQTFAQYGYQHIHTPAVESVDVLKKGGDEVSKQIFGLYGLAQGPEDAKDYALHFDLTVPFARYVLDRQNELAFPFKRYQIQPVWRGERSQRGRYKEFRQADIDVIWPISDDYNRDQRGKFDLHYDIEVIKVLGDALGTIFNILNIDDDIEICINNKQIMMGFVLHYFKNDYKTALKHLDSFHKMNKDSFWIFFDNNKDAKNDLKMLMEGNFEDISNELRGTTAGKGIDEIKILFNTFKNKKFENIKIKYDPTIVRGLDYYTHTVFETFIEGKKNLGSICSGGAYAGLTDMLGSKKTFVGIGGSIGLSRLMSVLLEEYNIAEIFSPEEESYLVIHEEKTAKQAQDIVATLRSQHKIAEIYPLAEKLDKQFKYAEKKGIGYVVQIFDTGVKYKKIGGQWEELIT